MISIQKMQKNQSTIFNKLKMVLFNYSNKCIFLNFFSYQFLLKNPKSIQFYLFTTYN